MWRRGNYYLIRDLIYLNSSKVLVCTWWYYISTSWHSFKDSTHSTYFSCQLQFPRTLENTTSCWKKISWSWFCFILNIYGQYMDYFCEYYGLYKILCYILYTLGVQINRRRLLFLKFCRFQLLIIFFYFFHAIKILFLKFMEFCIEWLKLFLRPSNFLSPHLFRSPF